MNRSVRWIYLMPVIACALLLAACGGAPTSPTPASEATQTLATTAPATTAAPTTAASAEAPAAETTAPSAPATTTAATSPAETTAAATSAPAAGASGCDHPYYPLRQGATWTYTISGAGEPTEQTHTVTKVDSASAQISFKVGDVVVTNQVNCSAEGLQYGSPPNMSSQLGNFSAQMEVELAEGIYLPTADKLVPGATWDTHYVVKGTLKLGQQDVAVTNDMKFHSEVVGNEQVTVPAGTFDALKLKQQITFNIQMANVPASAPPTTFEQFVWLAKGVGMVKNSTDVANAGTITTELKSYNIP